MPAKKRKVTVVYQGTGEVDFGELPEGMVEALLEALDEGLGESSWSIHDLIDEYETLDIKVE